MSTYCGTGTGTNNPLPGDPDNLVVLSAVAAFGGVDVSWTYPQVNPHAVSYVQLYRATSGDFANAVKHKKVDGDFYYDRSTSATAVKYYYWIEIVSINGTVGAAIGPASATANPTIADVMTGLTAKIDESFLGETLSTKIGEIDFNKQALYDEIAIRAAEDDALGVAYNQTLARSDEAVALIQHETVARTSADDAMTETITTMYSDFEGNTAAIEQKLGTHIETVNGDLTAINAYFTVRSDVNGVLGGFGMYNDGTAVDMGFNVDNFWVGRSDTDINGNPIAGSMKGVKPFIIEGDQTFIKEAVIQSLTFHKLRSDDGSVMFTPTTYNADGTIKEHGKLEADYLQINHLTTPELTIDKTGNLDSTGTMRFGSSNKYVHFDGTVLKASQLESVGDIYLGNPDTVGFLTPWTGYIGESINTLQIRQDNGYDEKRTYSTFLYTNETGTSLAMGSTQAVSGLTGTWMIMGTTWKDTTTDANGIVTYHWRYLIKRVD